ncbi:MAG: PAS domain S-box protein [Daejeonella sp.]
MEKKLKILHLEDSSSDAELVSRVLKKGGFNFERLLVDTKQKYIDALSDFLPDLILSDHSLPSFNSHEALTLFRETKLSIPFILITSNVSEEFAVDVIKRGADDYILKDRLERLPTAIQNALEKYQLEKEKQSYLYELSKNERHYRALIENGADVLIVLNIEGKLIYASPSIFRVLGDTDEEALRLNLFEVLHPDDIKHVELKLTECLAKPGIPIEGQTARIKNKNGDWVWLEATLTNMLHDPSINGIVDNCRDVTERKIAEQKLLYANRLYSFISQINQAIVHIKEDQALFNEACRIAVEYGKFKLAWIGITDSNTNKIHLTASYGASTEQITFFKDYSYEPTGPIKKVVDGLDFAIVDNIMEVPKSTLSDLAIKGGFNSVIVLAIKKANKLIATFNIYATEAGFFNEDEIRLLTEATGDISFALDVFEKDKLRTLAEQSLHDSELRLQTAQAMAKIGSWETDLNTFNVTWSQETYRIFELDPEFNPSHTSFLDFVHPNDRDTVQNAFNDSMGSNIPQTVEHRIITGKGNEKFIVENWQVLHNELGKPHKAIGTSQDVTDRKLTEEKLARTQFRYRQIVETAQEGIWLVNKDDKTIFVNRKLCEFLEYSKKEIIEKDPLFFMDEEGGKIADVAMQAVKSGSSINADFKYISKAGKELWASVSANPIFDSEGKYNGYLGMISDVTEKKAMEQLLEKAINLSRIGTYEIDLTTNVLYWSAMTKEIHEVEEDFIPDVQTAINFYKEGLSRETVVKAFKDAIENNIPFDLELQLITAKSNEIWVRTIGEAECRDGKCVRLYGSFQDINKVKNAELEVLKAYEEKYNILESIDDAFFAIDKNWNITYWNNKAEKLLGRSINDVISKNLWEIYPDAIGTPFYTYFYKAFQENIAQHFEYHYEALGKWFEVSCYPSANGISGYLRDVTDRKISENRLYELNESLEKYTNELLMSNKGLEQFSYIISHNLRSPVANVLGLIEIIQHEDTDTEVGNTLMKDLVASVNQLDEVILDLNSILKIKSEINELQEPVTLTELVDNIKSSIQNVIENEKVTILTSGIQIDCFYSLKSYLYSIFYNLITNSIKYRQPGLNPVIEIKSWTQDGMIYISLKDNGRGIDLVRNKDQVFGLYKRFHSNVDGKGMGLFMVKTQVEVLGVKYRSRATQTKAPNF